MHPLTISSNDKTAIDYQPELVFDSTIVRGRGNPHVLREAKPAKVLPVQFASALVHEVRNPLTNINLAIEMLESTIKANELTIYLDIIKRSSMRINSLISGLLNYQDNELQIKRHSIHGLLDEVLEIAEDRIKLKKIGVWKEYASSDCKMELNRLKMVIGLNNIIGNAIDAMTPGKGQLKVVTKSNAGKHVIQIEDNGCGISKEDLKNIFKPYFTNKPSGLGLGLAAAYDILQSNHVRVNVESEEGRGTRFILTFEKTHQYGMFKK